MAQPQSQQQQRPPAECAKCKNQGVIKQYIDFEKIGDNPVTGKGVYNIYDHGTRNLHVNKKACTYGCNTVIVWDTSANKYRDLEGGQFHEIPCAGVSRYFEMAERQQDIIDPQRKLQMKAVASEAQAVTTSPVTETITNPSIENRIELMWSMIKDINYKVDKVSRVEEKLTNLIDFNDKRFIKIEQFMAKIYEKIEPVENQFQTASNLSKDEQTEDYTEMFEEASSKEEPKE